MISVCGSSGFELTIAELPTYKRFTFDLGARCNNVDEADLVTVVNACLEALKLEQRLAVKTVKEFVLE